MPDPFEHYAYWKTEIEPHENLARPGAFGENLSTVGLTEDAISIGDVFEFGSTINEGSQGRQLFWKPTSVLAEPTWPGQSTR